ncbi:MAG: hypothetical protein ACI9VS_000730 [Candidatus Binatia bacterium]|jgi:hypothetical protein
MKSIAIIATGLLVLCACGEPTERNAARIPQTIDSKPIVWGETNAGLQLSIAIHPNSISSTEPFIVSLKVRNHAGTNIVLDAELPTTNGSTIIVKFPNGTKAVNNIWVDQAYHLVIPPGESELGDFSSEDWLFISRSAAGKKGEGAVGTRVSSGVYKIRWKLYDSISQAAELLVH